MITGALIGIAIGTGLFTLQNIKAKEIPTRLAINFSLIAFLASVGAIIGSFF